MDLAFTPACRGPLSHLYARSAQTFGHGCPLLCFRSDCLIKTIRSEGYFGMYRGTFSVRGASSGTHQSGSQSLTVSPSLFDPLRGGGELNTGHARESHQTGRQRLLQTSPLQGRVRNEGTLPPLFPSFRLRHPITASGIVSSLLFKNQLASLISTI